jgi:hypothetical protein
MPPPLNIPQNNNNVGAAVSSALDDNDLTSPMSGGPRRAAPEPNKRALYVGGLDPRVTEDVLKQIFETTGHVQNVKIIPDKNVSTPTLLAHDVSTLLLLVTPDMCHSMPDEKHICGSTFTRRMEANLCIYSTTTTFIYHEANSRRRTVPIQRL